MHDEGAFRRGASLFDRGEYFEAHEAWEVRWLATDDAGERLRLQGLIQVAAAFHKLFVSHSPESARRLLARGLAKLDACDCDPIANFDLASFRRDLHACEQELADARFERGRVRVRVRVPRMITND
jgi:hypothetical protein